MNAWAYDDNAIMLLKSLIPRKGELVRPPVPELGRGGPLSHPGMGDLVIRSPQPGGGGDGSRGLSQSPLMIKCKFFLSNAINILVLNGQKKSLKSFQNLYLKIK